MTCAQFVGQEALHVDPRVVERHELFERVSRQSLQSKVIIGTHARSIQINTYISTRQGNRSTNGFCALQLYCAVLVESALRLRSTPTESVSATVVQRQVQPLVTRQLAAKLKAVETRQIAARIADTQHSGRLGKMLNSKRSMFHVTAKEAHTWQ